MEEIGYKSWSLLPVDGEPLAGEPKVSRPPMMSALALDQGSSLVFQLARVPSSLQIALEVTAISAEKRSSHFCKIFTGATADRYAEVAHPGWEYALEGPYATFTTRISPATLFVKLHFTEAPSLVVNRVVFSAL
jgi:hypothetical protein